jgi:hypothetical protein
MSFVVLVQWPIFLDQALLHWFILAKCFVAGNQLGDYAFALSLGGSLIVVVRINLVVEVVGCSDSCR